MTLVNWSPGSRAVELWSFFSRPTFHPPPCLLYRYWANAVSSSSSIIPNSTAYASFILVSIKCNHGSFTALNVPPIIGFQAGMTLLPAIHCDIWWLTIRGVQWQGSWVQMWSSPGHRTTCMSSNGTIVLIVGCPVIKWYRGVEDCVHFDLDIVLYGAQRTAQWQNKATTSFKSGFYGRQSRPHVRWHWKICGQLFPTSIQRPSRSAIRSARFM